ncbi:DUF5677 domain-containing protein [Psychrobacillus sp. FSL K6-1267]|uniref:DUF5677 domain-containing protein n=1 Tax=Psychrobacillus sp. FSL K6-1267 TaxID=2921543 RepID=UPI0030FC40D3
MKVLEKHPLTSDLKPYFSSFVEKYLSDYFIETVQIIETKNDIQERALFFFVKTVNTLNGINELFKTGNIVSARILMRSLFEIELQTKKMKNDGKTFLRYSKAYELFKNIETCKIMLEETDNNDVISYFTEEELKNKIAHAETKIKDLGFLPTGNKSNGKPHVLKYFEIKQMAIDTDMEFLYKTSYKNLCMDTHTSSNHFYKYFIAEEDKKLLNLHPYLNELDLMICTVVMFIRDMIDDFCGLLGLESNNLANRQLQKLHLLAFNLLPKLVVQGKLKKYNKFI